MVERQKIKKVLLQFARFWWQNFPLSTISDEFKNSE
jgi:hypothetical protein